MKKLSLILFAALLCVSVYAEKAEIARFTVNPGETVSLPTNFVKYNSQVEVTVDFNKFQPFSMGCGKDMFQGCFLEFTEDEYTQYTIRLANGKDSKGRIRRVNDTTKVGDAVRINIPLKKQVKISIATDLKNASFSIESKGKKEECMLKTWINAGPLFFMNKGKKPVSVELSFTRLAADEPIWFYGDSYFSATSSMRWPFYMVKDGYTHWMADHKSGGGSKLLLECLKHDLEFGTPKIIVWGLGMNDADAKDGSISKSWLSCVQEVIAICKEKGITPVLTTIPSVPKRGHIAKTEWVRNSGCRYIDWYSAVMTDTDRQWKEGYLYKDGVHPDKAGAEALWKAVKAALPELEK